MWRSKLQLIILTTGIFLLGIEILRADHKTSCVGVSVPRADDGEDLSIGSNKFYEANTGAWWTYSFSLNVDPDPNFIAKVHAVQVDGKLLRGWFHIVLSLPRNYPSFFMNAVDISNEGFNVGEFVYNFPKCNDHDEVHEDLTEYMYLPCGGISEKEPSISSGIKFLRRPSREFAYLVPNQNLDRQEFHFMFRLATTPCTQPKSFGIYAVSAVPGDSHPSQAYTDVVVLNESVVIGAADPIPRKGTYERIDCHANILIAPYVLRVTKSEDSVPFAPCRANPDNDDNTIYPLFKGRCDDANFDIINGIHKIACPVNTFQKYSDYINDMTERMKVLCLECPPDVPPRPITNIPATTIKVEHEKMGVPLTIVTALEVWDARIIHGIAMTVISILILPLNIFITRHFKETFMKTRILLHRVWYFVHHLAAGVIIIFYFIGLTRVIRNRKLFGVNLHPLAWIHRAFGWASIAVTVMMTIFGGWRCMSRLRRNYCIALHFSVGMAVYITNYFLMILSVWISASPAAAIDLTSTLKGSAKPTKLELVVFLVIGWIILDVGMHVTMTVFTCIKDAKCKLSERRLYLPTPIPVLREHFTYDIIGSRVRIFFLVVYGSLSMCFTVAISYLLITQDESGRGLGEMSCTHQPYGRGYLPRGAKTDCDH